MTRHIKKRSLKLLKLSKEINNTLNKISSFEENVKIGINKILYQRDQLNYIRSIHKPTIIKIDEKKFEKEAKNFLRQYF